MIWPLQDQPCQFKHSLSIFSSPFLLLFLPHSFFFSLHPNSSSFVILSLCPAHSFVFSFLPFFLVLSPHFPPLYTTSYSEQRKVCQACYKVIESYLRGDSRKNENYLARFIKFFQTQVGAHTDTPVGRDCMSIQLIWFCFLFFKTHTHKHTCTNTHIYTRAFTLQVHMGLNAEEVMIEMVEGNA